MALLSLIPWFFLFLWNIDSLTLNKLRQKQMLEQKLEQRRALKMDKLQQKHNNEHKVTIVVDIRRKKR